jgi:hypothetical protein
MWAPRLASSSGWCGSSTGLELLTDTEVAKVSRAEDAPRLIEGDEYVDLADLTAGLQQAQATPRTPAKDALPRSAVSETSWSRILNALGS